MNEHIDNVVRYSVLEFSNKFINVLSDTYTITNISIIKYSPNMYIMYLTSHLVHPRESRIRSELAAWQTAAPAQALYLFIRSDISLARAHVCQTLQKIQRCTGGVQTGPFVLCANLFLSRGIVSQQADNHLETDLNFTYCSP